MTLSFHVCKIPCPDEVYAGVQAGYEAFFVDIPNELIPDRLLKIINDKSQDPTHIVTTIAAHKD